MQKEIKSKINALPKELRVLVKTAGQLFGEVVKHEVGDSLFRRIEKIRKKMTKLRWISDNEAYLKLKETLDEIRGYTPSEQMDVSHSFTLLLELINSCENAYRTYRLMHYPRKHYKRHPQAMIYVVTAHPTEARSSSNIAIFHEIQKTLTELLIKNTNETKSVLKNQLALAWHIATAKSRRPRVKDEAEHIYSILLKDETLNTLLVTRTEFSPIYIRSWVGGDKDGHPGVNEKTLLMSLNQSRCRILYFMHNALIQFRNDLKLIQSPDRGLIQIYQKLRTILSRIRCVRENDGKSIAILHDTFKNLIQIYLQIFAVDHPILNRIQALIQMFPALVIPMELREHSKWIRDSALGKPTPIERMLKTLNSISNGINPRYYVRGLIISMASSFEDIQAGGQLIQKTLGKIRIPIIPLFEQAEALTKAPQVIRQMIQNPRYNKIIQNEWNSYLEVMLGYSDSAKELGVFSSHLNIMMTTQKLNRIYNKYSITPVFFHGSGGSTDRGGGSIEEQTDWWPKSALNIYKATIQGEMVERTFASPEITRRRFEQIVREINRPARSFKRGVIQQISDFIKTFADQVSKEYQRKVASSSFLDVVQSATAYRYLNLLKIGSRPTKRGILAPTSISDLRTIPWVLCWTQTRVLFPTWWGVGKTWRNMKHSPRSIQSFRKAYRSYPAFRSYFKILSSTLARIELPIWRLYLENSKLSPEMIQATIQEFEQEYQSAIDFVRTISNERNLLWFRPWFGTSIQLRSPMIHPLNLLQIIAVQESKHSLLRETVTGIASGMMTTG